MRRAKICGKWDLPILPGKPREVEGHARSYYTFVNGRTNEIGRNIQCVEDLIYQLDKEKISTVIEPFGGIGGFTTVIQNVLHPAKHIVYEIDPDCAAQLENAFGPSIDLRRQDSRDVFGTIHADLYVLDIPSPSTLKSHEKWQKQWLQVTDQKPEAIIWHDSAARYLHLHYETYSRVADYDIFDHETYAYAMQKFMLARYNYQVTALTWSQNGHYFLAKAPDPANRDIKFKQIVESKAGFAWDYAFATQA